MQLGYYIFLFNQNFSSVFFLCFYFMFLTLTALQWLLFFSPSQRHLWIQFFIFSSFFQLPLPFFFFSSLCDFSSLNQILSLLLSSLKLLQFFFIAFSRILPSHQMPLSHLHTFSISAYRVIDN